MEFKKAVRQNVWLLVGLAGATGSGKTMSAMRIARGLTPPGKRFAVIDTERGRAKHYGDFFDFDTAEIDAPFRPERYLEAIQAAEKAGYPVIVVDSMSHEWAGDGGILDWQEEELERMSKGDRDKRDQNKISSWIKPKMAHKQFVQKLLQVRAHVVLAFRAEPKIDIVKEGGRTKIVPKESLIGHAGWIPICEKNLPFELTISFMLTADAPGVPHPIKLQQQHRSFFPLDQVISEESGRLLGEWAIGGEPVTPLTPEQLVDKGREVAKVGTASLQSWWTGLAPAARASVLAQLKITEKGCPSEFKTIAQEADKPATETMSDTTAGVDLLGDAKPTHAELSDRIRKAATPEVLSAVADAMSHLPEAQRGELADLIGLRRDELREVQA